MRENLLSLIRERTAKVLLAVQRLKEKFSDVNFLAAKNSEQIPKRGFLNQEETISYNFHGIGCLIDFGGDEINFDFDFNSGNHTGFNVWHVLEFLNSHKTQFPDLVGLKPKNIQTLLDELEKEKIIRAIKQNDFSTLYYLNDELAEKSEEKVGVELALS